MNPLFKSIVALPFQALLRKIGWQMVRLHHPARIDDPFQVMKHLLQGRSDPIIFDVGAHHGQTANLFAKLFPDARIFAFEPFPESYQVLQTNTQANSRIHTFNYGLSDFEGMQKFHSNSFSQTNSLFATDEAASTTWDHGILETKAVVDARFRTLDSVVRELELPRIDLLKMDVQGAEHLVLKGAEECCAKKLILLVFSEIITQPTYQGQLRFDHALAALYDRGFDLYHLFELGRDNKGYLRNLDALFVRKGETFDSLKGF
jgi:FkbM family methyltransferase